MFSQHGMHSLLLLFPWQSADATGMAWSTQHVQWSICKTPALFIVAVGLDISFCMFFLQNTTMQFQVCVRTAEGLSLLRKWCNEVNTILCFFFFFYVLLTKHPCTPTWCTIFLNMFISFLYVFQATMCPSLAELTVSMRHLVFVTLCGWLSGMQGGTKLHSTLHTRQSSTQSVKYQVSHRYS